MLGYITKNDKSITGTTNSLLQAMFTNYVMRQKCQTLSPPPPRSVTSLRSTGKLITCTYTILQLLETQITEFLLGSFVLIKHCTD